MSNCKWIILFVRVGVQFLLLPMKKEKNSRKINKDSQVFPGDFKRQENGCLFGKNRFRPRILGILLTLLRETNDVKGFRRLNDPKDFFSVPRFTSFVERGSFAARPSGAPWNSKHSGEVGRWESAKARKLDGISFGWYGREINSPSSRENLDPVSMKLPPLVSSPSSASLRTLLNRQEDEQRRSFRV